MTAIADGVYTPSQTREEWLERAVFALIDTVFAEHGIEVPAVRVSCGWPSTRGRSGLRLGECWHPVNDSDDQVFISPVLDDPPRVLDVLVHELVHAVVHVQHPDRWGPKAHRGPFRRIALAVGLTGKMTATVAGPVLAARLAVLADGLGPYPHEALPASARLRQSTRMHKLTAPCCGYTVRTTMRWITEGLPTCPCPDHQQLVLQLSGADEK